MSLTRLLILQRIIRVMLIILVLAFAFVLFRSLGGPSNISQSGEVFDDIVVGQTALRRYEGQRVWATRLSAQQRRQAGGLESFLLEPASGCDVLASICVVVAATMRSGIELQFTEVAPDQLSSSSAWHGGFVDPTTGAVYDRLGRSYQDVRLVKAESVRELSTVSLKPAEGFR